MDENEKLDNLEVEEDGTTEEVIEEEATEEVIEEEATEEVIEEEATEEAPEEKVSLKKYMEMKRKAKELENTLNEKKFDDDIKIFKNSIKEKYKSKGFDPDLADLISDDIADMKSQLLGIKKQDNLKEDIQDLIKENPLYKDAINWEKDITKELKANKGLTLELAYIKARGGLNRILQENKIEDNLTPKKKLSNNAQPTTSSGNGRMESKFKLDADDKKALAMLQKYQPDKKWTAEKYFKSKK
jgi:ribosomal protein L22